MGIGDSDGEFIERIWNMLNFIAMITKSMKKETRLEMLETALSLIAKDMTTNLTKSLLKRKLERMKILQSIQSELEEKKVDVDKVRKDWQDEMESYKNKNCKTKETQKMINNRMILLAQVDIF